MQRLAQVFKEENCSPNIMEYIVFLLAMYGAPVSEVSIDKYRYLTFAKSTRLNTPVKFPSLPPTSAAAQQLYLALPFSIVYGHCREQSCLNSTTNPVSSSDSDEININKTEYDEINPIDYLISKLSEKEGVNEEDEEK
ncbi:hypothetical protein PR048_016259 [Dryococelus australis]|uniref:Uncharacterized protein n=1 Tax=Dryococelus australis TaxID=614101 RepID=A0ABQ9HJ89_9NEOP|nr:hypothetical protein PR048_016259 [Dryococelus australis]